MSYKKHGGLHFVRIGRFGFSFFIAKRRALRTQPLPPIPHDYFAR